MNTLDFLLDQLRDTNGISGELQKFLEQHPDDAAARLNIGSIDKRRADLERRLSDELRAGQNNLVKYHINERLNDRYPVLAVANTVAKFQELFTSVFDAIRGTPKRRY